MKLRLSLADFGDIIYEKDCQIHPSFHSDGILEKTIQGNYCFGKVGLHEIQFDDVFITYGDLGLFEHTFLSVEDGSPFVQMHFTLSGDSRYHLTEQHLSYAFSTNQHNLIYLPHLRGEMEICNSTGFYNFEVGISISRFEQLFAGSDTRLLDSMLNHIRNQRPTMIGKYHQPIPPQINFIIHEIISCERTGYLKKLFLEAKIIELFLLQVEQFEKFNGKVNYSLEKQDAQKIYEAKALVDKKIDEPWSLFELARMVGINNFKLKKGFKEIFGTTVFGYLNDLKMERAKSMLLNQNIPISEVSRLSGFKNQTHFTVAFKKKFGILPSSIPKVKY